ncbi:MAG: TonB-dependent receptor, partial [Alphaproteobacteria bacterium]|nr:TonB-dependent receptor [Alphaproteobacteria bacterium]
VVSKKSDGFGRDIEPLGGQGNLGEDDDIAGRAQFLWTPSDRAEFDLAVEYSDRSGTAVPQARIFFDKNTPAGRYLDDGGTNSVIGHNRNFKSSDLEKVTVDTPMLDELEVFGIALVANFEFDGMTLKSITAYRDQEAENGQDFDGGRTPTINQTVTSEQEQFSQEFQLTGQTENGKMDWLLGAYYFEEEGTFITDVQVLFPTSTPAEPLKFGAVTPLDIDTDNETESYAAFAQANYQITDKLSIAGGVRYTEETKSILINTVVGGVTRVDNGRGEQTFDAVTPKLSIDYQVHDDLLIYASIAQGFRSGGYNGRAFIPNQLAPFTEETSTSYELGFKSDLFENRLRFNLAGFLNEYEDIQLTATATDALGGLIVTTANAGDMDLWGFEVEIEALPTENLTVFSSVGYVTSDQLKPKPGFRFQATTLPLASKWTVNVGTEYVLPMNALFGTKLGIDYAYQSGFFPQFDDSPLARQEGYGLLNARVQFTPQNEGNWTLTLWGKNIRDKVYRTAGQDAAMNNLPVVVGFFGPTREYGATFAFSF